MTTEDELSKLVRCREQKEKAEARHAQLSELVLRQQFLEEEDREISNQLVMSKPLVTEMLKFLNQKGTNEEATLEMTKLIAEIAESLNQTRAQAQMFRRAAFYDSASAHVPF